MAQEGIVASPPGTNGNPPAKPRFLLSLHPGDLKWKKQVSEQARIPVLSIFPIFSNKFAALLSHFTEQYYQTFFFFSKAVDRGKKGAIMRPTEQSMIEARKRRVSTTQGGGNRRCERLFRRRVSAFPDGYAWAATEYAADCRLRAESCQTTVSHGDSLS